MSKVILSEHGGACLYSCTWETEARRLQVQCQPELHSAVPLKERKTIQAGDATQ